jgi:phosphomannomutase
MSDLKLQVVGKNLHYSQKQKDMFSGAISIVKILAESKNSEKIRECLLNLAVDIKKSGKKITIDFDDSEVNSLTETMTLYTLELEKQNLTVEEEEDIIQKEIDNINNIPYSTENGDR